MKRNASRNWGISTLIKGTRHYTNHVEVIAYGGGSYAHVKTPKRLSWLLYHLESIRRVSKTGYFDHWTANQKIDSERNDLIYLRENGLLVPEVLDIGIQGVLVTEFLPHDPLGVSLSGRGYDGTIRLLSKSLRRLHSFGIHGEPVVDNCFIHSGQGYFADLERFRKTSSKGAMARDLKIFIDSICYTTPGDISEIEGIAFEEYDDQEVIVKYREYVSNNRTSHREYVSNSGKLHRGRKK